MKRIAMDSGYNDREIKDYVSVISIDYKDGYYEVTELAKPISKHKCLQEAQWVRSVLESNHQAT